MKLNVFDVCPVCGSGRQLRAVDDVARWFECEPTGTVVSARERTDPRKHDERSAALVGC